MTAERHIQRQDISPNWMHVTNLIKFSPALFAIVLELGKSNFSANSHSIRIMAKVINAGNWFCVCTNFAATKKCVTIWIGLNIASVDLTLQHVQLLHHQPNKFRFEWMKWARWGSVDEAVYTCMTSDARPKLRTTISEWMNNFHYFVEINQIVESNNQNCKLLSLWTLPFWTEQNRISIAFYQNNQIRKRINKHHQTFKNCFFIIVWL